MASPEKKRRKYQNNPTPQQSTSILSLPDDLLLTCIARVSRLYYPTLSLVSKHFRSLVASPDLYKFRSLLGYTESCLYICLSFNRNPHYRWFTLCRKPDKTLTSKNEKKKSSGYVLATVPVPDSPSSHCTGLVASGSSIYSIGRSIDEAHSCVGYSSVSVLDCMTHTWNRAPSLPVKLHKLTASFVDSNVYVARIKVEDAYLKKSFHVLDTETQIWNSMPIQKFFNSLSVCIDGKFQVKTEVGRRMGEKSYCVIVIDNVLCSALFRPLRWYDTKVGEWRELKGLVGLPELPYPPPGCPYSVRVRLADCGGKMAVFWEESLPVRGGKKIMISCVVIALERRESGEIWGNVEWFDEVLTVPRFCGVVKALAVTV